MNDEWGQTRTTLILRFFIAHSSFRSPHLCRRHRIDAAGMPGMAFEDAFHGEPGTAQRPVYLDRLARVARARRVETALRAEKRGEQELVAVDQGEEQRLHRVEKYNTAPGAAWLRIPLKWSKFPFRPYQKWQSRNLKRVFLQFACIFLLLFAQQSALTHAAWHAQPQPPAQDHSKDKASFQGGLCGLHVAFSQVLGAVQATPAQYLVRDGVAERIAQRPSLCGFVETLTPLSRGPPVLL